MDHKDEIKKHGKIWTVLNFIFNPRLLLCFAIAWMITNGWSYAFVALGGFFKIHWMLSVGAAYAGILWFPFTPEKLITVAIACFLLKRLFPNDTKTLAVAREMFHKVKNKVKHTDSGKEKEHSEATRTE